MSATAQLLMTYGVSLPPGPSAFPWWRIQVTERVSTSYASYREVELLSAASGVDLTSPSTYITSSVPSMSGLGPARLLDNNPTTEWMSATPSPALPFNLDIDLGTAGAVGAVRITPGTLGDLGPYSFDIWASNDGYEWARQQRVYRAQYTVGKQYTFPILTPASTEVDVVDLTTAGYVGYGGEYLVPPYGTGGSPEINLPAGWRYQTVGGATNKGTILIDHPAPAWLRPDATIHTAQAEFAMQGNSASMAGFHAGIVSRHPGVNYVSTGDNRSCACIWGYPNTSPYQFALENIEFGTPGTSTRDPWYSAANVLPVANGDWVRYAVHTRYTEGESHSRAQAWLVSTGTLIADSGWKLIPPAAWGTLADYRRETVAIFHVGSPDVGYMFRNVKSAWRPANGSIAVL